MILCNEYWVQVGINLSFDIVYLNAKMVIILIPDSILDVERTFTASEISIYDIDAGPGGTRRDGFYPSARPELRAYYFYLRSVFMDSNGLYYMTIRKKTGDPSPP